jgi:tetratricopeptide (TPR) repeat protein
MATVYLARDLRHDRLVALKVLRSELAVALGTARFEREIGIAARLHHPLILPVFDSGTSPGGPGSGSCLWYTMPYVQGESLRDRLHRERQLAIDEALQIGCEVADALGYAHAHGVIHRDIKPENIMLSGEHALVADFGIARAFSTVGNDRLTETGLSLGTPAYMSPEQAAGDDQLDRRSDLYSLGCVLYEMLAGQPPFTGSSPQAIMARHAIDPVPSLRTVRANVPTGLEAAIRRALCKVPGDRFASSAKFIEALKRGAAEPSVESSPQRQATRPVPKSASAPAARRPALEPPTVALIGRAEEWKWLQRAWHAAQRGLPRCALVSGVAGIGKTRLVEDFLRWADNEGATIATSRCYGAVGKLPYAPLADWLRSPALELVLSTLPQVWRAEIAALLPEVALDRPEAANRPDQPHAEARRRLFEAMVRAIAQAPQPVLLFLDDIQWTDRDSLEWIRYFLQLEGPLSVLVLATLRLGEIPLEDQLAAVLLDLRREGRLEEISLEPLNESETGGLAAAVAGTALDPAAARALHRETEGHPLYIVEMMRSKAAGDEVVPPMEASARRATTGSGARQSLPQRVLATIEARLGQLSPPCRMVVGVASVIGREFRMDLLAEGSEIGENEAASALDELLERRLVREQSDGSYDFGHASIREVAYTGLSSARRRVLHQRIARALIASAPRSTGSAAMIAKHLEQAGLFEEAIPYCRLAAEHARDLFAGAETVLHLEKAVELLQQLPTSAARLGEEIELRTALCVALAPLEMFSGPRLREQYGRLRALCDGAGITPSPRLLRTLAIAFVIRGEISEAAQTGEQLLASADKAGDRVLFVEAQYVLGVTAAWRGDPVSATRHFEAALEAYRPDNAHQHITFGQDPSAICGVRLAQVLWMNGRTGPARRILAEALARAEVLEHPYTLTYVRQHSAWLLIELGDYADARRQIDSAIELAEANAFSGWSIRNRALHGFLLTREGQAAPGIALMRSAAEEWLTRGFRLFVPYDRGLLAQACLAAELLEEGFRALEEGTTVARETGQRFWDAELLRLRGELLAASGAPAGEVRRMFQEALDVATRQGATALVRRAERSLQRLP